MALAAHNSGGKVFVQVRDVLEAGTIDHVGSSYQEFWLMASLSTANNRKPILVVTT